MSIVADGADGAMGSVLTHGRYPDCPRSQPPLVAEDNFDPECAEEGVGPPQPASECAGTLCPASSVGADLQKVGCAFLPLRSVGHELAHMGRDGISVDDILDRSAPVVRISGFEGACGSKCASQAVAQSAIVVSLAQPGQKALAAQRPAFPVAVDDEVGKTGAIACVKELGGRRDIKKDVRGAHGVRPWSAGPVTM
jgi:hypothetical protein